MAVLSHDPLSNVPNFPADNEHTTTIITKSNNITRAAEGTREVALTLKRP